jgi:flagellar assembly protein FliH
MKEKTFIKNNYLDESSIPGVKPEPTEDYREVDFEGRARQVLDSAIQKAAHLERQAYEAGFAKGELAGIEMGKQKMMPALDRLQMMMEDLAESRKEMLMAMEGKIVKLAVDIAEKIVHITIDAATDAIKATVTESILQSVDRGHLVVYVSPGEHEVISELKPEILSIDGVDSVSVLSDPDVTPGGCRVTTSIGGVDATIETAIKEIKTLAE